MKKVIYFLISNRDNKLLLVPITMKGEFNRS